jgi:hypothetical protein
MSDARRLSSQPESELEGLLLRAGRVEPPPASREKAFIAASSALAATLAAGGGAASRWSAASPKASWIATVKWLAVVALAAAGAAGMVVVRDRTHDSSRSPAPKRESPIPAADFVEPSPNSGSPAERPPPPAEPAAAEPPAALATPTAPAAQSAPTHGRVRAAPAAPAAPALVATSRPAPLASSRASDAGGSNVAAELAMLDDVRRAIAKNELVRALSILDEYQARFPHGTLAAEATILRIATLVRTGDGAGAKRLADAFLATHPDTLYVSRVRSLLGASNP